MPSAENLWRNASALDDERIIALCLALYAEDPSVRPVPADHTRATLARFRAEPVRGKALVLEVDGRVEGYSLLASFWSNELGGELCTVDEIYVSPAHRGRGHARRILGDLLAGSELWGRLPKAFDLEVTPDNLKARAFYESLGFKPAKNAHLRFRY